MKVKSFFKYLVLFFFLFSGAQEFYAQTQGRLRVARRQFGNACINSSYNNWKVFFYWEGAWFNANNVFYIELSDPNGSFDNPTLLKTVIPKGQNQTNFESDSNKFSFPENTFGKRYRIRVRSTNPVSEVIAINKDGVAGSESFEAIYMLARGVTISPQNVTLCPGHTQELKVIALPNGQPVSNYRYVWGKMVGSNRVPLQRDAGPTFTVSEG